MATIPVVRRYGRRARLRAGTEEEYDRLHAAVWPEVLAAIRRAGIRRYTIFRHERDLFSYFELPDDVTLAEVQAAFQREPACGRWEERMQRLQQPLPESGRDDRWVPMAEVFHCEGGPGP